jgi:LacI family transcriptional regulator, galactose operon repressor
VTVTIDDIAKTAGVSRTTVSRVLNDSGYVKMETREKIIQAIKELNYTPSAIARSLSTNKTNTIGVIVPDINNSFFGEVIKGISEVTDRHNLNMILCDTDEDIKKELKAINLLKEQRIQGLIISSTSVEDDSNSEYLRTLESLGIPVVLVDGHVKYSTFSGVFVDNIKGTFEGTDALIKAGHKKIAIITGRMNSKPAQDRLEGYKKALSNNGLPIEENYIFYGDYRQESAYKITKQILQMKNRPTAIFVSNNMMTLGCIKALFEENITIPDDIAIVGFDRIDVLNIIGMNISFIDGPTKEMGKLGAKLLVDNLLNKESREMKRVILEPKLVLKGSEKYMENCV